MEILSLLFMVIFYLDILRGCCRKFFISYVHFPRSQLVRAISCVKKGRCNECQEERKMSLKKTVNSYNTRNNHVTENKPRAVASSEKVGRGG